MHKKVEDVELYSFQIFSLSSVFGIFNFHYPHFVKQKDTLGQILCTKTLYIVAPNRIYRKKV